MIPENKDYSLSRMTRSEAIAREKVISENEDGSFFVPSQTVEEIGLCKHIHAVKLWVASQTFLQEKPKPKIFSPNSIQCQKCGSIRVAKYGFDAEKQIYKCRDCKTKFRYSSLKKAKYSPETVSLTLNFTFRECL